jgi:hypothetical protein
MKMIDFPCTNIKELIDYSHWIPETIALFNKEYSSMGVISHVPCRGLNLDEDKLEYWDNSQYDITYGRYLQFTNTKWEIIEFWTGFSTSPDEKIYCIWFSKKNPLEQYLEKLKTAFPDKIKTKGFEIWISMESTDITKETVKKFWQSVLELLK